MSSLDSKVRATGLGLVLILGAAACSDQQSPPAPDMPLRTKQYYLDNQQEMRTMLDECERWKASKTPIGAIPAIIISNCSNAYEVNGILTRPKRHW